MIRARTSNSSWSRALRPTIGSLPAAHSVLEEEDRRALDAAFSQQDDPLTTGMKDPRYERLFTRIVLNAPAPIGVGTA